MNSPVIPSENSCIALLFHYGSFRNMKTYPLGALEISLSPRCTNCKPFFSLSLSLQADIYFTACPPNSSKSSIQATLAAGPASPVREKTSLYKISTISLMGQFLDPPLARKPQLDVSTSTSNGKNASEEELSIAEVITGKRNDSSKEAVDSTGIDSDSNSKGSPNRTTSCAEARKVSEPTDPRGAVKYSGNLSWTMV